MPYSYPDNIPSAVKNLPAGAQKLFIDAFNAVIDDGGSEEDARKAGWANVKREYEKSNDKWVKKEKEKAESTKLILEVSGFNQYDKEYCISLKGQGLDGVSITFKNKPPEFLSTIGNKIFLTLSDEKEVLSIIEKEEAVADREKAKEAQESRSSKYGIAILDGGNVTKPSEYSDCSDSKFADPVNYNYPMDNETRAKAAVRYFGMPRNYGKYSDADKSKVWSRMIDLAKSYIKDMDETAPWKRGKKSAKATLLEYMQKCVQD